MGQTGYLGMGFNRQTTIDPRPSRGRDGAVSSSKRTAEAVAMIPQSPSSVLSIGCAQTLFQQGK